MYRVVLNNDPEKDADETFGEETNDKCLVPFFCSTQ